MAYEFRLYKLLETNLDRPNLSVNSDNRILQYRTNETAVTILGTSVLSFGEFGPWTDVNRVDE